MPTNHPAPATTRPPRPPGPCSGSTASARTCRGRGPKVRTRIVHTEMRDDLLYIWYLEPATN